jgi:hypothetical protein
MGAPKDGPLFDLGAIHELDEPMRVRRGSYRRFSQWIDEDLSRLIARWLHTAAPAAGRSRQRLFQPKPK